MRITPLLPLLLALASPASAASVTLTSGVDNTLYESSDGSLSNGAGLYLFAGTNGSAGGSRIMRSVVAFDLSAIPDAARVDSVELLLEAITPMFRSSTVQVHRLTRDWGEGSSSAPSGEGGGAASTAGDATWIHTFYAGSTWTSPGGDFDPAFSDSLAVSGNGSLGFDGAQLTGDVQGWLDDPSSNFGWLFKLDVESALALRFGSFQGSSGPRLHVEYTLVPEPATALLLGLGLSALCASRRQR